MSEPLANLAPEHVQIARRMARDELIRRRQAGAEDLFRFVSLEPGYLPGWVHLDLCRRLEQFERDVRAGKSPRLIIAMPPRAGKTKIVSQKFPAWYLGRNPTHDVVCASYGQKIANKNSRHARAIVTGQAGRDAFPHLQIVDEDDRPTPRTRRRRTVPKRRRRRSTDELDAIDNWRVRGGGGYQACGTNTGLTGHGAHVLVIDDPIKDRKEAESATVRASVWDWYTSTAYTRLAPGGGVIVMATRWHEDDLTGRLLKAEKEGGDKWDVVSYPAVADEDETASPYVSVEELRELCGDLRTDEAGRPLFRRQGEALHPARYDVDWYGQVKHTIGVRDWSALYQQRPVPSGGGLFQREWFGQRYNLPPWELATALEGVMISVDATFRDKETSDFVVMQVWGWKGPRRYLLGQTRARMNYPATKRALRDLVKAWPTVRIVLVEAKANGDALIAELKEEIPGVIGFEPGNTSKPARAQIAAVPYEAMQVWLPDPQWAPWIGGFVEEHVSFPAGANDDQVDAGAQALIYLRDRMGDPTGALRASLGFLLDRLN